jgi:6-phosphogluconolactonase
VRTGKFVAVANYTGGNIAMFPVGPDGRLAASSALLSGTGFGPNKARQQGPHAHQVVFDPTNHFLLEADLGIDRILVYRFDQASGRLTPNDPPSAVVTPGSGPRHLAFHPNGRFVFVINELSSTVTSFAWEGAAGSLRSLGTVSTLPAGDTGENSTAEIAVHPNGRFLYGSNRGHDSLAVFSVAADGTSRSSSTSRRVKDPAQLHDRSDRQWLVAANQPPARWRFAIDRKTGALSPAGPLVRRLACLRAVLRNGDSRRTRCCARDVRSPGGRWIPRDSRAHVSTSRSSSRNLRRSSGTRHEQIDRLPRTFGASGGRFAVSHDGISNRRCCSSAESGRRG